MDEEASDEERRVHVEAWLWCPLHRAATHPANVAAAVAALAAGADPDCRDHAKSDGTPLSCCAESTIGDDAYTLIGEHLLAHGADPNLQHPLVSLALRSPFALRLARALLTSGADPNRDWPDYGDATSVAFHEGHWDMLAVLEEFGADVRAAVTRPWPVYDGTDTQLGMAIEDAELIARLIREFPHTAEVRSIRYHRAIERVVYALLRGARLTDMSGERAVKVATWLQSVRSDVERELSRRAWERRGAAIMARQAWRVWRVRRARQ